MIKIIYRLLLVIFFVPVLMITLPFEIVFYTIRWIITGKPFGMPIIHVFMSGDDDKT